jgi:hypothetical protein
MRTVTIVALVFSLVALGLRTIALHERAGRQVRRCVEHLAASIGQEGRRLCSGMPAQADVG